MYNRIKTRIATIGLLAFSAMLMAVPAFATPSAGVTAVNDAVSDAAGEATSVITAGIPILLGVAALWVVLRFGKRLLAKIG